MGHYKTVEDQGKLIPFQALFVFFSKVMCEITRTKAGPTGNCNRKFFPEPISSFT
jgi:hypothetical protein